MSGDNRSYYRVALLEAAAEQRRLAAESRTNNGEAEHTDFADWLEERAEQLAAHPVEPAPVVADHTNCTCDLCAACPCSWAQITVGHLCDLKSKVAAALLDRAAVKRRLETARGHGWTEDVTVDAVLELARPMPTDAEIHEAIDSALDSHAYDYVPIAKITVALRALLNGADS